MASRVGAVFRWAISNGLWQFLTGGLAWKVAVSVSAVLVTIVTFVGGVVADVPWPLLVPASLVALTFAVLLPEYLHRSWKRWQVRRQWDRGTLRIVVGEGPAFQVHDRHAPSKEDVQFVLHRIRAMLAGANVHPDLWGRDLPQHDEWSTHTTLVRVVNYGKQALKVKGRIADVDPPLALRPTIFPLVWRDGKSENELPPNEGYGYLVIHRQWKWDMYVAEAKPWADFLQGAGFLVEVWSKDHVARACFELHRDASADFPRLPRAECGSNEAE